MTTEQTDDETSRRRCHVRGPVLFALLVVAAGIAIIVGAIVLGLKLDRDQARKLRKEIESTRPPVYSVSVTGVAGLDDASTTLSPVFNLTLLVSNARDRYQACVPLLSTVSVLYGDALLGRGSVPPFCAEPNGECEGRATAWGQDVVLPRFLRDQLAAEMRRGDAAVDVAVKMPAGCDVVSCYDTVLVCRAKIRGGSPCIMAVTVVPKSTLT